MMSTSNLEFLSYFYYFRDVMPVDVELAVEAIKKYDEKLYEMYRKVKEVADYVENNPHTFEKLRLYLQYIETINDLERMGTIEVTNDYERRAVYIRRKI